MREFNAHIGQICVAKKGEILKALLGSCVGIGILWPSRNTFGLAHCLLPEAPCPTFKVGGRYVNQAVWSLLALMKVKTDDDYREIRALVAGGGNMTKVAETPDLVGDENVKRALTELKTRNIKIILCDVGGTCGRRILINGQDGSYSVEKIPRIEGVA